MIICHNPGMQPVEEDILRRAAADCGGSLRVPVLTRIRLKSGMALYFGDQLMFTALPDGGLQTISIPTFPSRNRSQLRRQMADAAIPCGIRPYARRKREVQVAVADLLRHLCRCEPVLERCPWLPEQVAALELLEAVS